MTVTNNAPAATAEVAPEASRSRSKEGRSKTADRLELVRSGSSGSSGCGMIRSRLVFDGHFLCIFPLAIDVYCC